MKRKSVERIFIKSNLYLTLASKDGSNITDDNINEATLKLEIAINELGGMTLDDGVLAYARIHIITERR